MPPITDFEQRVEWLDKKMEYIPGYNVSHNIHEEADTAVWELEGWPTQRFIAGTHKDENFIDILYTYNLLLDIAMSFSAEKVDNIIQDVEDEVLEELMSEAPPLAEELEDIDFEGKYDELAEESLPEDVDSVEEIREIIESDELEGLKDADLEQIELEFSDDDGDDFARDWAAAKVWVNTISDSTSQTLRMKLTDILSEDMLAYSIETTDEKRVHRIHIIYRLIPEKGEQCIQDVHNAIRKVKVQGHYAENYLRYAYRLTDEFDGEIKNKGIKFPDTH